MKTSTIIVLMLSVVVAVAEDVIKDNIDLPFVNDPQAVGEWRSVDLVAEPY